MPGRIGGLLGLLALTAVVAAQPPPGLPSKVNLTHDLQRFGITSRVQGDRNTCSLFATTALAEFECARSASQSNRQFSVEFLVWAASKASGKNYDQAMFYEAIDGLNDYGICAEDLMPYMKTADPRRSPSAAALAAAKPRSQRWQTHWIKRWDVKLPMSKAELLAIRQALSGGHPVACGLRWPKSLSGYQILDVPPPDKVFDGHSIALTGYKDDPKQNGGGTFRFLNSDGPHWGDGGNGIMSYAYVRRYANDCFWLRFGPSDSEVPAERFEAERAPVLAKGECATSVQNMRQFGRPMWSQGRQLFCQAQKGGFVELGFTPSKAGRYRLRVLATAAPDYGRIRAALDGRPLGADFDLYCGRVCPAGSLELGTLDLAARPHRLRFTSVAKSAASGGFSFGVDAIDLIAAK